jgi:starch phosphorylase
MSLCRVRQPAGAANGYAYRAPAAATHPVTDYTTRVIRHHDGVAVPLEVDPILWQR